MSKNDVRKNFVFKKDVALHLEELAKKNGKSMTVIVQDLIEKEYEDISKEERLDALYEFFDAPKHDLKGATVQSIKASWGDKSERYGY